LANGALRFVPLLVHFGPRRVLLLGSVHAIPPQSHRFMPKLQATLLMTRSSNSASRGVIMAASWFSSASVSALTLAQLTSSKSGRSAPRSSTTLKLAWMKAELGTEVLAVARFA